MAYPFRLTTSANQNVGSILDYLNRKLEGVGNPLVAKRWLREFDRTIERITNFPESYALCEEEKLRERKYRKAHLKHYKYKIFYFIRDDGVIIVDLVCHDSQNYGDML